MHYYCCNDVVPWLNEAKSHIFQCTVIFKKTPNSPVFHLTATCLPSAVRPGSAMCTGPIFLKKIWHLQYESVVSKKIYPLCHGDSFHPSLAFTVLL